MKKRNSFAILSLAGVAVLGMTACNSGEEPGPEEHQHSFSELHEKVDPTCLTEGREAYYTCDECDKIFNENKEEISEVVAIPTIAHVPHHHEGVAPGCETTGLGEYWTCDNEVDEKLYGDAQCTQVISEVPVLEATGHDLELQEGQDSTCTEAGWKDYYQCNECKKYYEDKEKYTQVKLTEHKYTNKDIDKTLKAYFEKENIKLTCKSLSNRAFYRPSEHSITCPKREQFADLEEFYSTLFHESVHSTSKTLKREISTSDKEKYSFEELVAELGAMMLCEHFNINSKNKENSIAYIKGWAEYLKENTNAIIKASTQSEKAVKYILGE